MKLKIIACNVFLREICLCVAESPHTIDVEFTELGEHAHSATLRGLIQSRIDAAEESGRDYDAVALAYGLCGNSTVGLRARKTRLVIPRAHDCCTVLLGSRQKFRGLFEDHPSTPFSSAGYLERGSYYLRTEEDGGQKMHYGDVYAEYVKQYGEENAKYIWETMHPERTGGDNRVVFIDLPETAHLGCAATFRARAEAEGKNCLCVEGSLALLRALTAGDWNPDDFLVVQPGQSIAGVYDWSEIVRAVVPEVSVR
jgi:hypothetical protein